ncbi:MAG: type II secretion system protein GspI [Deltaproteobacteria bacterium RBG_19FT_COMBO_43_11]|nr:MAG: type II secretion system protein GspI [Deltaproteobacteria bacterium RBG_16_44_11]OGP88026.1 MAG: type II secretion system protein GspI [Deltaproteobacteria bacterium RBG_19FT_COMBO_43_11]
MQNKNAGFTLMEVLIAMAILAIALVGVFQLQSQSISMATDSRFMTTAALLAQSKMVEIESGIVSSSRAQDGDFGDDYPQYSWRLEVTDTQLPQFKKIEVTVRNKAFLRGGTYKLVLYKATGI